MIAAVVVVVVVAVVVVLTKLGTNYMLGNRSVSITGKCFKVMPQLPQF